MQWEEVPEEEVKTLKYASRHSGKDSIYADLLEAVKSGKTIRMKLEDGTTPKAMSQRLYTAAKAIDMRVTCRTLDSKDGIVISLDTSPVKPEEPEPPPAEPSAPLTEASVTPPTHPAADTSTPRRSKDQQAPVTA